MPINTKNLDYSSIFKVLHRPNYQEPENVIIKFQDQIKLLTTHTDIEIQHLINLKYILNMYLLNHLYEHVLNALENNYRQLDTYEYQNDMTNIYSKLTDLSPIKLQAWYKQWYNKEYNNAKAHDIINGYSDLQAWTTLDANTLLNSTMTNLISAQAKAPIDQPVSTAMSATLHFLISIKKLTIGIHPQLDQWYLHAIEPTDNPNYKMIIKHSHQI